MTTEGFFGVGLKVSIDPATDVDDARARDVGRGPRRISTTRPPSRAARMRTPSPSSRPEQLVLGCRAEMVLEEAQAVDGP